MDKEEARAFHDGIDFYVHSKKLVISVRRDYYGEIYVTKHHKMAPESKPIQTLQSIILILMFSLLLSIILNTVSSVKIQAVAITGAIWVGTFVYFFRKSRQTQDYELYRYHAAEHKALNYLDYFECAPSDVSFIKNMSSYSVRCGSTLLAVGYVFATLCMLSIVFVPILWLKILACLFSAVITFLLWGFDCLNFFQKFVIREPTTGEVEVALEGLKEYVKEKGSGGQHEKTRKV